MVEVVRNDNGEVQFLDEHLPPPMELLSVSDAVVDVATPTDTERAALNILVQAEMATHTA
jgi:hypothetical protein